MKNWINQDIEEIRKLRLEGVCNREIANRIGAKPSELKYVIYKHRLLLPTDLSKVRRGAGFRRMWQTQRKDIIKWTPEKIKKVREFKMQGISNSEIAKMLNTTSSAIDNIVTRYRLVLAKGLRSTKARENILRIRKAEPQKFIHKGPRFWTEERKEKLKELVEKGFYTQSKIAGIIGCSKMAVNNACFRFGIRFSKSAISSRNAEISKNYWLEKYKEMGEILAEKEETQEMGYIIAVSSLKGRLCHETRIIINSKDIPFLKYFRVALAKVTGKKLPIKRYGSSYPQVCIYDSAVVDTILWRKRIRSASSYYFHKYGEDFWRGFLQGFFDVKAEVYPKKRLWQIRAVSEPPLLNLIRKYLTMRFDIRAKQICLGRWGRIALTIIDDIGNLKKFRDKIGFRHSEKREKLEELIERVQS